MNIMIRSEEPQDYAAVYTVNTAAFETPAEAKLVEVVRKEAHPIISLVAEEQGEVVGHILFSPVRLSGHNELLIMGLGPMAVTPACQGKGMGSALVKAGLEKCKVLGYGAVVVLGHTWFYPRFGFTPAEQFGIRCEYDAPVEAFMLLEIRSGYLRGSEGTIRYHPAFDNV